ncbi:hypothetical protein [Bdellovibrio svalbardensis]|uniref:FCP1 homology domain-containing protein n=1 Tax=Bdellovibrio svalbardensis TaxID=2972972 RepID=A0ABT6DFH1_9BACT|nr:hypothetical protein [Bdellovibrio svalbardensis]MDG0815595.1 hypothetical protein [Bdellovibrio svalbardensis]
MKLFLASLFLALSFQGSVYAQAAPIDIVFDIDWTTFYSIDTTSPNQIDNQNIAIEGKTYRPTEHLGEVLQALSLHPEVRISFFSGGEKSRNEALLKKLILPNGRRAFDIAYRVLSKENLQQVSEDSNLKFSQRYKKSFEGLLPGATPQRTILIDDQVEFSKAPWKAVPSLGVFNYQKVFDNRQSAQQFYPSTEQAWLNEKDKALMWKSLLEEAIVLSRKSDKPFSQITSDLWSAKSQNSLCKNVFIL